MAHVTSGPIANVDYSELSRTDWQLDPKPITVTTDSSFERFKAAMGMQSREVFDKLVIASSEFSYDTVLELDRNYRKLLSELPAEDTQKEKMKPELRWKRLVCREAIEVSFSAREIGRRALAHPLPLPLFGHATCSRLARSAFAASIDPSSLVATRPALASPSPKTSASRAPRSSSTIKAPFWTSRLTCG